LHSLLCTQTLLHFTLNKVGWSPLFSVVEISEGKSWFKFKSSKNWNTDQCIINGSFSVCSPKMFFPNMWFLFNFLFFPFGFHSGYWPTTDVRETDDPSSGSLDLRFHQNPIPCPSPQTSPSPLFVVAQDQNMQIKYACLLEGPQGDRMLLKVQNGEKVRIKLGRILVQLIEI
jgi:hypothetical protein